MRTLLVSILCAVALTSITGCGFVGFPGVYKINVEQGNIIDQKKVDKLKIGMSRRQVRFILGTPMIEDSFNHDRWDYLHTIRNGKTSLVDERLTVFFEGDKLSRIDGDFQPTVEEEPPEPAAEPEPTDDAEAPEESEESGEA
jgi:outer membrane protein assembly factor BamE